jgi:hypothetical protein
VTPRFITVESSLSRLISATHTFEVEYAESACTNFGNFSPAMSDQVDNTNTAGNNGSSDESTLRNRKIGFVSGIKKSVKEAAIKIVATRHVSKVCWYHILCARNSDLGG